MYRHRKQGQGATLAGARVLKHQEQFRYRLARPRRAQLLQMPVQLRGQRQARAKRHRPT